MQTVNRKLMKLEHFFRLKKKITRNHLAPLIHECHFINSTFSAIMKIRYFSIVDSSIRELLCSIREF